MGDIVGLVERASETIEQEDAERLAKKMARGTFDLDDYASQLKQITKMGSIQGILGMLPGAAKIKDQLKDANLDTGILKRQAAIISSMTKGRAQDARHHQGQPQEAHRRRVRGDGAGGQPPAQAVRRHQHHDEAHDQDGPERPDARQGMGALMPKPHQQIRRH